MITNRHRHHSVHDNQWDMYIYMIQQYLHRSGYLDMVMLKIDIHLYSFRSRYHCTLSYTHSQSVCHRILLLFHSYIHWHSPVPRYWFHYMLQIKNQIYKNVNNLFMMQTDFKTFKLFNNLHCLLQQKQNSVNK